MVTYGGDEVSALVLEVGSQWTRAGYAGEDTPKAVLPSRVGHIPGQDQVYIGDNALSCVRAHLEITAPVVAGHIHHPEYYEKLVQTTLEKHLRVDPRDHPLLLVEPSPCQDVGQESASSLPTSLQARQKWGELLFETCQVPAAFLARDSVLTSFSAGKPSGLVVDLGAGKMSVVPVVDGYALLQASVKQSLAGDYLTQQWHHFLRNECNYDPTPVYELASKKHVAVNQKPQFMRKLGLPEPITASYRHYVQQWIVADAKEATCQMPEANFDEAVAAVRPGKGYEFPDGFNRVFGAERYRLSEILFQPQLYSLSDDNSNLSRYLSLPALIQRSIDAVDHDHRHAILQNIILSGGTSLLPGLVERLYDTLCSTFPSNKIKIHASTTSLERKQAAWLGGSILASLGTFQQLWVSREEWQEHGVQILEKRCV